ncbi:hypothetical protein Tco_0895077 [Tanacetum coccineum]|uniref:Uncharacterized protein n=1 Tax=Tanacetum coccineum TaxID=301880 RepID=A0ABQ5CDL8_9ASTR
MLTLAKKYTGCAVKESVLEAAKRNLSHIVLQVDDRKETNLNLLEDIIYCVWRDHRGMREKHEKWNDDLLEFIAKSPTSFEVNEMPMNGKDQWPSTSTSIQKPFALPIKRRMPGRPPHKRKRDAMEDDGGNRTRISRKGQIGHLTGTGKDVTASVGNMCASGGMVTARGGSVTARGGKVTARGRGVATAELRTGVVYYRHHLRESKDSSVYADTGSSSMNGLRTVNGKDLRILGSIDVNTKLGDTRLKWYPRPTWPDGITTQDCIIEAATQS